MDCERTTLAIAGACCTRDAFNSRFVPDYKEHFTLLAYEFQPSLISLMDAPRLAGASLFESTGASEVEDSFHAQLRSELSKDFLVDVVRAQPEFLLIDFYADVFWGVVARHEGGYLTARSLFTESSHHECQGKLLRPDTHEHEYRALFDEALGRFAIFRDSWLAGTHVIINGARFSESYIDVSTGERGHFCDSHPASAEERNRIWESFDAAATQSLSAHRLTYSPAYDLDPSYPFGGLAEVHYVGDYYEDLSRQLRAVARDVREDSAQVDMQQTRTESRARYADMSTTELRHELWPDSPNAPSTAEILTSATDPYRLGISEITPASPLTRGWLRDALRSLHHRHSM